METKHPKKLEDLRAWGDKGAREEHMEKIWLWTARQIRGVASTARWQHEAGGVGRVGTSGTYLPSICWTLDAKDCTQHLVGEIKHIHLKTTRTQTTYGTDEQMENAVVSTLYINTRIAFVTGEKWGSVPFHAFKNKRINWKFFEQCSFLLSFFSLILSSFSSTSPQPCFFSSLCLCLMNFHAHTTRKSDSRPQWPLMGSTSFHSYHTQFSQHFFVNLVELAFLSWELQIDVSPFWALGGGLKWGLKMERCA